MTHRPPRCPALLRAVVVATLLLPTASPAQSDDTYFRRQVSELGVPRAVSLDEPVPSERTYGGASGAERMLRGFDGSLAGGVLSFGRNLLDDLALQAQAPVSYARRNPLKFAFGTAGVLTLIATDHLTHPALTGPTGSPKSIHMQQLSDVGNTRNGLYLIAGLGAVGVVSGSKRERRSAVLLAEALVTSALWTTAFKSLSGRERPRELEGFKSDWQGPSFLNDDDDEPGERTRPAGYRSFPSGHATGAWATATVLAHQYPTYGLVPTLAYGSAAVISYSRLRVGAHWLSDVVVGALVGIGSARVVLAANGRRSEAKRVERGLPEGANDRVRFGVDVSSQYKGVHIKYDF